MLAPSSLRLLALFTVTTVLATTAQAAAVRDYGKLPLGFEANQGQSDRSVRFLARGDGYGVYLTDSGAVLALGKGDVVEMTLAGAARSGIRGEEELPGKVNYFVGNDPKRWRADLPTFARVRYSGVYPGVDLVYYGNQRQLEYDFVVAPGARYEAIRLHFKGLERVRIDGNGNLFLRGGDGSVSFQKPLIYQFKDGQREEIAGSFEVLAGNTVGFKVGKYDHSRALVIDPVLVYSTYLGGSGGDKGNGVAVDSDGSAYVVGEALSTDFPVTSGTMPYPNKAGGVSAPIVFVSKFSANGATLVYSTYLGGSYSDVAYGIALDSAKNAYITGSTTSADFPVTCGAFQAINYSAAYSATSAFVSKLNATGDALVYSTFLGGTGSAGKGDVGQAIAVDSNGGAYVTGYTSAFDFPVTNDAWQRNYLNNLGNPTAFVTKLNADGTALGYSTYLGGQGSATAGDYGNAIAVDDLGHAFVTGNTGSPDFPITSGAFQKENKGATFKDTSTAFVTELNATGTGAVYSTFLGGSEQETGYAIAVDGTGAAYVGGTTQSFDFPTTSSAMQGNEYGALTISGKASFVSKITADGSNLVYSTYLQGAGLGVTGLAVDSAGVAYVTGTSPVSGFAASPNALTTPTSGADVGFVVKLNAAGTAMNYASLIGSSGSNVSVTATANAIALDTAGNVYIAGYTDATDFPTKGAFQATNHAASSSGTNAFVTKLALAAEVGFTFPEPPPQRIHTETDLTYGGFSWIDCPNSYSAYSGAQAFADDYSPLAGTMTIGTFWNSTTVPVDSTGSGFASWTDDNTDHHVVEGDQLEVAAQYSGDGQHDGSFDIKHLSTPYCEDVPFVTGGGRSNTSDLLPLGGKSVAGRKKTALNWRAGRFGPDAFGPKFVPVVLRTAHKSQAVKAMRRVTRQDVGSCALSPLKVILHGVSRFYGSPNPAAVVTLIPSLNQNTLTVTDTVAADATSPVGLYPLTGSVSGPSAASYSPITVTPTTLKVKPAVLGVVANSQVVPYGQAPTQPTGYSFVGFVNGENASVVSGSPVLSTNVTATTPPGYYNIQIALGSLSASNYVFTPFAHPGSVHVDKAPLTVKADHVFMPHGGPIPALTYGFSGFVNGESAAGTVTGVPFLLTHATTHSAPGDYPIYISVGSLKSNHYRITAVAGVLTITP